MFLTTQYCACGLCDTHMPDLNPSASQNKRSFCSRVSRDRRNRGVSGASFLLFTTHFLRISPGPLPTEYIYYALTATALWWQQVLSRKVNFLIPCGLPTPQRIPGTPSKMGTCT